MPRPPFTPWRDGPPHFIVGLKPIEPARWLLPDTETHSLPERRALVVRERRTRPGAPSLARRRP